MNTPFKWDEHSDQPHIIRSKIFKKFKKKTHKYEYLRMFIGFILILPFAWIYQVTTRNKGHHDTQIGVGVNLDKGEAQFDLVQALGVKHLLVRMPLWEVENIADYVAFVKGFGADKIIMLNLLQDANQVGNQPLLKDRVMRIFTKFSPLVTEYQVGNAVNRSKWGFFAMSEYLNFYQTVQTVRDEYFPELKLIGPSVIDFEYYYTSAALFNFRKVKFDALSSLLYVDRRGSPNNKQYGFFNAERKINLLHALMRLSPKVKNQLYITEVNWPLKNTAPFAPTSEKECVSEAQYTQYMQAYIACARQSKQVARVYWHQLIAPGYGLVDNRNGLRKTPAFYDFKALIYE
jgi:hypothetical protein